VYEEERIEKVGAIIIEVVVGSSINTFILCVCRLLQPRIVVKPPLLTSTRDGSQKKSSLFAFSLLLSL